MQRSRLYPLSLHGLVSWAIASLAVTAMAAVDVRLKAIEQSGSCTIVEKSDTSTPLLSIPDIGQIKQTCAQIADSLQAEMNKGDIESLILIADTIGRRWKVCIVRSSDEGCTKNNVLFDIPRVAESNPEQFLSSILAVSTEVLLTGTEGQQTPRRPYSKFGSAVNRSSR
jgi:hypothetical protein